MASFLLIVGVGLPVGLLCSVPLTRRRLRRDAAQGRVDVALRTVAGEQPPLTRRWRHGVLSASAGLLQVRPGGPWGMRLPRGRPFDVPVVGPESETRSHPSLRQLWTINPSLDVVRLRTHTATVELAALPAQVDRVLVALRGNR